MPTTAELMDALPESAGEITGMPQGIAPERLADWALRPVPVGAFRRLRVLGTMQAEVTAAYLFLWLRGWFKDEAEKEKLRAETQWTTALRILDTMSYLRGATIKIGQMMATFPDIMPGPFVETFEQLHFDAPPMHWSLLKEMVHNELGDEPDDRFATFNKRAFAAASMGQVHRARLKSGEDVAIKVQYPGIARTIRDDFRNLFFFLLPARFSRNWKKLKAQFEDLRLRLERETDYEQEADIQERVRKLFRDEDRIVVPRVYREHSTGRILAMDYLPGQTLDQFVAANPSQKERNHLARLILRAWYRMLYAGRLFYADIHPGNFLLLDDGRLGLIDFGFMLELDNTLWQLFRNIDRPQTTGLREERRAALKEWDIVGDEPADQDLLRLSEELADWFWKCRYGRGEFDFGDESDFRHGVDLMVELGRARYSSGRPCALVIARQTFGIRSILYRLKAKIDVKLLAEADIAMTGWDRSEYAQTT
ncbi:MAG TPA: AarF/ABC1/UbiB kinase family protein [Pirellulaceae bacterium]|nr:AarF/ABC1/UbiB kinase family protein [Pirellulaceae bacterium]